MIKGTIEHLASVWNVSLSEATAIKAQLDDPYIQATIAEFRTYVNSPQGRTSAYKDCLTLLRDPMPGVWPDGSRM